MEEGKGKRRRGVVILAVAAYEASREMLGECLFRHFAPYAIDVSPDGKRLAYFGECDVFELVGPDEEVPRYMPSFRKNGPGKYDFATTFARYAPLPAQELAGLNPPPALKGDGK